jgi:hypothetical protein
VSRTSALTANAEPPAARIVSTTWFAASAELL